MCYSRGLVFSRRPNEEHNPFERSSGCSLVWKSNCASGKRLNAFKFYWLGELASFSKYRFGPLNKGISWHWLVTDRPCELPAWSVCTDVSKTMPFHEASLRTQLFIRTLNTLEWGQWKEMYYFLAQYDWKNSAVLKHFQSRAWKGLFAVMKHLRVWALVCEYTAIDWNNAKNLQICQHYKSLGNRAS